MKTTMRILGSLCLMLGMLSVQSQSFTPVWEAPISGVTTFCSPRTAHLNADNILDIVVGAGKENQGDARGIFAFDGADGHILWQRYTRNQVYGSPLFQDINLDGVEDVFITGRDAQFYALNGSNGQIIWEFWSDQQGLALDSGWFNFYLPQWIPDQNQDGFADLIVTNGGDATLPANHQNRPPGYLMVLSGSDGTILQLDTMPDRRETYHSPLVVDFLQNGNLQVLFGSGGETVGGSFYRVELSDFMNRGLVGAQVLLQDSTEGYIAVSSIADLNQNGIPDIIVPQLNAQIIALEGSNGQVLWEHTEAGTDCYVSPTIGQFTGDETPDVFVLAAEGNWPFYQQSFKLLLDGATGQLVWSEAGYPFQLTSGIALDWDNDGFDEILFPNNQDIGDTTRQLVHQFSLYDFNDQQIIPLDSQAAGVIVFSVPLVQDLNANQSLDLIYATHDNSEDWYQPNGFTLHRKELGFTREEIAWGGYLGTNGDGIFPMNLEVSLDYPLSRLSVKAYPNPVSQTLYFHSPDQKPLLEIEIFDQQGKRVVYQQSKREVAVGHLPVGLYFYQVQLRDQVAGGKIWKR